MHEAQITLEEIDSQFTAIGSMSASNAERLCKHVYNTL
jgi:hypothetical protein